MDLHSTTRAPHRFPTRLFCSTPPPDLSSLFHSARLHSLRRQTNSTHTLSATHLPTPWEGTLYEVDTSSSAATSFRTQARSIADPSCPSTLLTPSLSLA